MATRAGKARKRSGRRNPQRDSAGVRRHARQLQILNEIARIATQGLELRPMLQRVTDAMRDRFGWEFVACVSVDLERRRFVCEALSSTRPTTVTVGYSRELGSGVVGEVAATGQPLLIDDVRTHANYIETMPGALSELCVPVKHGGRLIAILNLESRRLGAFHGQVGLLETVAEQVAGAIASARLYEELRRRAALLEILSEVSRTALEAVDLDSLLERVAAYVHRRLGFAFAAILLHDETRHELALAAFDSRIPLRVSRGDRWPVNKGVIGRALSTGEPQLVLDVRGDPDYVPVAGEITSELAVPVRFQQRILGVINVETTAPEDFSGETVRVLNTLADQVAGAVHLAAVNRRLADANQRLRESHREIEEAQATIARLADSSRGAAADVPAWSQAAATEIARVIGSREIGLWEVEGERLVPLAEGGTRAPTIEELKSAVAQGVLRRAEDTVVPVAGISGDLHGALVVAGPEVRWSDSERRLVAGFAHQLGGALEVRRMRRQLAAVEERRTATRREMHDRGIATLQVCPRCGRCYDHTLERCPADGGRLDSPRPLPYVLLERYRLARVLGQGGMGTVFEARDLRLERDVAIKLIRPEHFGNADMRHRFESEARVVARIQHPGVIGIHDSGELDDATAFLVMERLVGCDLGRLLERSGPGTPRQVGRLLRQGAAALAAAHRADVAHRDIKPENVFLVDGVDGFQVKLLDFGLAKSMVVEKGPTQAGLLIGTPAYMSPEQVRGERTDRRSDLYSFAAVAYEALVGRRAVGDGDLGRILIHVTVTLPPPVSSWLPGTPPEVDRAFAAALAKEPDRRPTDVEAWAGACADALDHLPAESSGWPDRIPELTRQRATNPSSAATGELRLD